ncbi:hypothetical protein [Ureibacillus aquaedulcis]|uniref:Uncharacterized protein n=1 Tax=Ureibacillus aquaedulcis TaxID=3058421 RepID=A0ABT8GNK9_9BACL|nr:hypothetical protein [Ureibacillus sp. BA0131]MDN4492984.1 hypothetical protein [Ureibacillus sp. BA0131]
MMNLGGENMNKEVSKKEKQDLQLALYVFPAAGIGALIGLLTYINDWL